MDTQNRPNHHRKQSSLSIGLSAHGMPRSPPPVSPGLSVRSHRFEASSPPAPPSGFSSPYQASMEFSRSPRPFSEVSNASTYISTSPMTSPSSASPPTHDTNSRSGKKVPAPEYEPIITISRPGEMYYDQKKNHETPSPTEDEEPSSPITRWARRIRAAFNLNKNNEKPVGRRPSRPKMEVVRIEETHWTEI